jgi:membrane protein
VPERPIAVRLWWTLRDYTKRVWDNSGEDNIFFLAGGIAFNILLAIVPFVLLIVSGLAYFLSLSSDQSSAQVVMFLDHLLPLNAGSVVKDVVVDIISSRGAVGLYSAIGFVWFSTRLFGSLRTVLSNVFDIDQERGIIAGKIFDIKITAMSSLLLVMYTAISAYLATATSGGVRVLATLGIRRDVMGQLEYIGGRVFGFVVVALAFFLLYKYLPKRQLRWKTAMIAALFTGVSFELARFVFAVVMRMFNPASYFTGTISAIVATIVWVYYAAMIFILGGEVAQVYELRRVKRMQREAFE